MKKLFQYMLLITLLMSGCESDADNIKVPEFRQKLVVTGFLSPSDSVSYIHISSNWPIYGIVDEEQGIGNITGYISDGTNEAILETFEKGLKLDQKIMKIDYGKTYTLKIQSDKGLTAEATCTVPQKRVFSIETDTFSIVNIQEWSPHYEKQISLRVSVTDIPGEENYYSIGIKGKASGYLSDYFHIINYSMENAGPYFIRSDKNIDGEKITWDRTGATLNYFYELETYYLVVYLYHTEKSYYLYHKSLNDHKREHSPFSEPNPIYSNITGGLGVFTSYTVDSLVVNLYPERD
jgi:hypothetical protein